MAQYKVPQNVDIEDKVIAGLTLRQFAFLMFAGGIVIVLRYVLVGPLKVLWIPSSLIVAAIGFALAFLKVNDRPFEIFLISAGKTFITPARRIWKKEINDTPDKPIEKKVEAPTAPKESYQDVKNKLEKIALIVDTGGKVPESESRLVNPASNMPVVDTDDVHDVLDKTERKSEGLEEMFSNAVKKVGKKKKEPTISNLASMPVDEKQYSYDQKLPIKSKDELERMVEGANEKVIKKNNEIS